MTGLVSSEKAPRDPKTEPCHALVVRVASSSAFQKTNRLRELLVFLCGRALASADAVIREQEIGVEVFGRSPGYDTAQDNLVRVQASQLRKKLQQYFAADGSDEPVLIEIPKGSYIPIFRNRETAAVRDSGAANGNRQFWARPYPLLALVWVLLAGATAGALAVWLPSRLASHTDRESRPTVDALWRQIFGNGRPACVVPSDANLVLFQDLIGRQMALNEYKRNQFVRVAEEEIADRERSAMAKSIVGKPATHIADARLVGLIGALNSVHRIHTDVVFARDFGIAYLQSHNVVLLGTRRANPWLEMFENQLNFRTRFQEAPRKMCFFENHAPLAGESATYAVDWGRKGYCRVAFLPNSERNGNVLLISGTDLASTEAGGEFIGSERWLQTLRSKLGLRPGSPFPNFEALLGVEFPVTRSPKFEIVAHRIPKT